MRPMGITSKLTHIFVLTTGLLLAAVSGLSFTVGRSALEAGTISELLSSGIEKESAINSWISEVKLHAISVTALPSFQQRVAELTTAQAEGDQAGALTAHDSLVAELRAWTGAERDYLGWMILDAHTGEVMVSTNAEEEGDSQSGQPYFLRGRSGVYMQYSEPGLSDGSMLLIIAAPVNAANGELLAILAGQPNLARMNTIVSQRSGVRYSDDSYLVDASQQFVTTPRFIDDPAVLSETVRTDAVTQCLARNSGAMTSPDYRGVMATIVYRWMPESQLCLITKIDRAETLAPVRTLGKSIAIGSVLGLLAAGLMAYWLARTLTRPIEVLEAGAQAVGSGNLDYRIPLGGRDELGRLAKAFNRMTADLQLSMEHAAYSQRVVLTLSGAGQAVQRAHTAQEVFRAVSEEVSRLHYVPMFFALTPDGTCLSIPYLAISQDQIRAVEALMGFTVADFQVPVGPDSLWQDVIAGDTAVYFDRFESLVADGLPRELRPLASQLVDILAMSRAILAPLTISGEPYGLLGVSGPGITRGDVPGVAVLANQISVALENSGLIQELKVQAEELRQHRDHLTELVAEQADAIQASEAELRALFAALPEVILVLSDEGRYLQVAPSGADLQYKPAKELEGRLMHEVLPRETADFFLTKVREALQARRPINVEYEVTIGDGQVWFAGMVSPMTEHSVIWAMRDITDRRLAEAALLESEMRFRSTFEQAAVGFAHVGPEGRFLRVNQRFCDIVGYSQSEILAFTFQDMTHPEDLEASVDHVRQVLAGQVSDYALEKRYITKSGQPVWVNLTVSVVRSPTDEPEYLIVAVEDISWRKRAEQDLREIMTELARSNEELQQFAYVASHDLQEPLRMVSSYVQLLQRRYKGRLDDDADEFIHYAVDGAERMKRLINDLLAFSRVGTRGKAQVPIDSQGVLERALASLELLIEETGATVTYDPLPVVLADDSQLTQLFQNLIANAIKFRREGVPPSVHIAARLQPVTSDGGHNSEYVFSVNDNGIGFEPQYAEKIFVIFERLHTSEKYGGTGIGLAICKKIIERHGGRIWTESRLGEGSTFYFTLRAAGALK